MPAFHESRPPAAAASARSLPRFLLGISLGLCLGLALNLSTPNLAHAQTSLAIQTRTAYQHIQELISQRQYAQAITAADDYLANNSRDPQVRFLKGVAQTESGDTQAGIQTFTDLIAVYPELPEPYNNLATIYASQGEYGKARDALLQAIQANPAYAVAHENLGDVYAQLSAQQYREAQSLDTRNTRLATKLKLTKQLLNFDGSNAVKP